jgi:hypothetical protein
MVQEFSLVLERINRRPLTTMFVFYSKGGGSWNPLDKERFDFIQTLVHYKTGIDVAFGFKMPVIAMLQRLDANAFVKKYVADHDEPLGVFICGSLRYCEGIQKATQGVGDVWVEGA